MEGLAQLLPLVILIVAGYFLIYKPQQDRRERHRKLIASLQVGDGVVTLGGLIGRVVAIEQDYISLELAPGVVTKLIKGAIAARREGESQQSTSST